MISIQNLTYAYPGTPPVLNDLSLTIETGSHVAVMGPNGSGKSTLALLMKGLYAPVSGSVTVDDIPSGSADLQYKIMKRVGLVFQNPDNTIVTTTVEEELAFGLENLGVPPSEMRDRVDSALDRFGLSQYRHTNPTSLSGGEKQRLALASVLIMRPRHLVLDEPTSLLDPPNRERLLDEIKAAVSAGSTVIHITQFSFEAIHADRLIILDSSGTICHDGDPASILEQTTGYRSCGVSTGSGITEKAGATVAPSLSQESAGSHDGALKLVDVGFFYDPGTPYEHRALGDVSLEFSRGTSTVILGPSGSGKTTLLEIAAGITPPSDGKVEFPSEPVRAMAFQLPEDQMFGHTVADYIAFGPSNIGVPADELDTVVDETLEAVGLDPEHYRNRDPFTLSGGEQRLTALAGVLAMEPDVLVLDEPTAGLDYQGMETVIDILDAYRSDGRILLFSTHDLEVAHRLAEYAVVLDNGGVETTGEIGEAFRESGWLRGIIQ